MFPVDHRSRIRHLLAGAAETALQVADAMLQPSQDVEQLERVPGPTAPPGVHRTPSPIGTRDGAPNAAAPSHTPAEIVGHPHRRTVRTKRRRRPGAVPAPAHHCLTPVQPRNAARPADAGTPTHR